jgi:hypothetical protein
MLYENKTKADGYITVSQGEAFIQLHTKSEILGIVHSDEKPEADVEPDFKIIGSGDIELLHDKVKNLVM